jgi:hypothetical protein
MVQKGFYGRSELSYQVGRLVTSERKSYSICEGFYSLEVSKSDWTHSIEDLTRYRFIAASCTDCLARRRDEVSISHISPKSPIIFASISP